MLHAQFTRGLRETWLLPKQNHFDIREEFPRFDGITLNRGDVGIREGFGGGEERIGGMPD
jgi:hypothetical protein